MTPIGQIFAQPSLYQVMNTVLTTASPVDVTALKAELANSPFTRLPRFTSLLHRDPMSGQEHWRRTRVIIEDHVKVIDDCSQIGDVNDYLADLAVSCPLPTNKPLWEIHVLPAHSYTIIIRTHHALADGLSMMSLLQSFGCTKSQPAENVKRKPTNAMNDEKKLPIIVWDFFNMIWFTFIYAVELIMRLLVKDDETMLKGGDGVELWPRKLATASFLIEDMKAVKTSVLPNATINDVMLGIVSLGLSLYMHLSSPGVREGTRITAFTMANLRSTSGIPDITDLVTGDSETWWGNKVGFLLHPIRICKPGETDPVQHLKAAQAAMNKKKISKVAHLSHLFLNMARTLFSPKLSAWLFYRAACNTTLLFSNTMGPTREIYMAGNLVTSIKASATGSPQAVTIHAVSYVGKVEMQVLVAKDIVPDPDVLAKCFEEALQNLKKATMHG
uniref:Diacylglycerol O-acyltransferase n=1 Tax=Kalanchoe fedtschenkoi TaxID=63787 RepID=A0A7N0ZR01_KALFE